MLPRVPNHIKNMFVEGGLSLVMKYDVVQVFAGLVHDCAEVLQTHEPFGPFGDPGSCVTKRTTQVADVCGLHCDAHRKRTDAGISPGKFLPHPNHVFDLLWAFEFNASEQVVDRMFLFHPLRFVVVLHGRFLGFAASREDVCFPAFYTVCQYVSNDIARLPCIKKVFQILKNIIKFLAVHQIQAHISALQILRLFLLAFL
jgi:hypothetical protein